MIGNPTRFETSGSVACGERNFYQPRRLRAAADYISAVFTNAGYHVNRQSYDVLGGSCDNFEVEIPGTERPGEIVVVDGLDEVLASLAGYSIENSQR